MKKILLSILSLALAVSFAQAAPRAKAAAAGKAGQAVVNKMLEVPEVKDAQEKVWDARLALYEARHERNLATLDAMKAEVEKNNPADKDQKLANIETARANADKALDLQKQLVAAERAGEWDKAKSIRTDIRKLAQKPRAARAGAKGKGAKPPAVEMPVWGDEGVE